MYAIVEIAGKQYKVREKDKLIVPRLSGEVDETVTFDRVLLVANEDENIQLGTPVVPNASVTATIVEHVKGDKVLVFRKKRRKRFKVKRGHRQPYTRIEVSGLSVDGSTKDAQKSSKPTDSKKEKPEQEPEDAKADSSGEQDVETAAPAEAVAPTDQTEAPKAKQSAASDKEAAEADDASESVEDETAT